MKRLLIMLTLAALVSSCSEPAPVRGLVRGLVPQQVGDFKLKGEIKPIGLAPPDKYKDNALIPTEGVIARYEAPAGGTQLALQIVNYPSASAALQSVKQFEANVGRLENGAKLTEGTRPGGKQGGASRKLIIEGIVPGFHQIVWVNESVIYELSGDNLQAVLEFEQNLPQ
jgi:hypothetical protein